MVRRRHRKTNHQLLAALVYPSAGSSRRKSGDRGWRSPAELARSVLVPTRERLLQLSCPARTRRTRVVAFLDALK